MENQIKKFSREENKEKAQLGLVGRVESTLKFVFKYIILPLLLWELGFRLCYRVFLAIFGRVIRFVVSLFLSDKGGLFNGIDDVYGTTNVEESDTDSLFDELQREDKKMRSSAKRRSLVLNFNSWYLSTVESIYNQQFWLSLHDSFQELGFILDKGEYVFDRYIKHSPFCILDKLSPGGKKPHYEYNGIPLSKYEGYGSYLRYKRQIPRKVKQLSPPAPASIRLLKETKVQSPIAHNSPEVKLEPQSVSRLTQTETIKRHSDATTSVAPPANFNFAANSFPTVENNHFTPMSPKRIKLDNTRVQVSGISKPSQEKTKISTATNKPRIINIEFPNKQKSGFKLLIRPKTETNVKKVKQDIEVLSTSSTRKIIKSISIKDVEYVEKVKHEIRKLLPKADYDDGSLGPIILRLAWHCCATYNKFTRNGGSNGATMRFVPELTDDGNSGLDVARSALEPIKQKFPLMTYSDLWTLAGKVAIEEMGGPLIPWQCGRVDCIDDKYVPPNGRLPFAYKNANHIRETFGRMGFNDREMVLLLGAHGLGRCHKRYSGWDGKWTKNPIVFSNEFFVVLLNEKWTLGSVPETGKDQYYNEDKSLIMLNTDIELIRDSQFLQLVELYSQSQSVFFQDFSIAFGKLLELGIERDSNGNVLPKEEFLGAYSDYK